MVFYELSTFVTSIKVKIKIIEDFNMYPIYIISVYLKIVHGKTKVQHEIILKPVYYI
jgi:hypothetical protein